MLNLAGADTKGQRAKRAVRGGMGIPAHNDHARQGETLLRSDHMHNALADIVYVENWDAGCPTVLLESFNLLGRHRIFNRLVPVGRWHVMVGHGYRRLGAAHVPAGQLQTLKRLWRSHLVGEVTVNIQERGAVLFGSHHVRLPYFFKHCLARHDLPLYILSFSWDVAAERAIPFSDLVEAGKMEGAEAVW